MYEAIKALNLTSDLVLLEGIFYAAMDATILETWKMSSVPTKRFYPILGSYAGSIRDITAQHLMKCLEPGLKA